MSIHIGNVETQLEILPDSGPGVEARDGSPALDERSRRRQQRARDAALALRTRAEGLSDD